MVKSIWSKPPKMNSIWSSEPKGKKKQSAWSKPLNSGGSVWSKPLNSGGSVWSKPEPIDYGSFFSKPKPKESETLEKYSEKDFKTLKKSKKAKKTRVKKKQVKKTVDKPQLSLSDKIAIVREKYYEAKEKQREKQGYKYVDEKERQRLEESSKQYNN
jgi:hypothetical protein